MSPEKWSVFGPHVEEGFKKAGGGKSLANFDVAPFVTCVLGDDLEKCRNAVKPMLALYIGGMGARGKSFYTYYAKTLGSEDGGAKIRTLLAGDRNTAMASVPNAVDEVRSLARASRSRPYFGMEAISVGTMCLGTESRRSNSPGAVL
jgi:hypothetical protein